MAGGSFSKSSSKSQLVDKLPRDFKDLREPFADLLEGQLGNIDAFLSGDLNFEGSGVNLDDFRAPITAGEQRALTGLEGLTQPGANELLSSDLIGRTLGGDFLSPDSNPGLQDLIRFTNQEINAAFNDEGLEQKALFARAGQTLPESSPFAQAAAKLESGRLDAIGKNTAALSASNFQAERDRQVQAIEQTRANAGFEFNRQLEFLQASALPRLIDEIGIDRAFQEFRTRLAAISQALGIITNVTAPVVGNESRSNSLSVSGSVGGTDSQAPSIG